MHFLLSNDDGYQATGLELLARSLSELGRVTVVAPERDRSGASNSLTLDAPLFPRTAANGFIFVNGTPTDCVHLAITGLLDDEPDMVISGINSGANLGDDVLYSGTVAAAMEGRFLGRTALAVSLVGEHAKNFNTAVLVVRKLLEQMLTKPLDPGLLLNINVPDVPYEKLGRLEVTRLGQRHKSEPAVRMKDPRNRIGYWVGPVGPGVDEGPGTDFYAVSHGNVSITPLQYDLTRYGVLEDLSIWVSGFELQ
jgi:5'-nucleotidase